MALSEPPTNIPRIVEVLDPASNGYLSVSVRMPTHLGNKFPDEVWGTAIDRVGLAKKDSDRFVGYTLVDIEPMKGGGDLLWIFEKLDGPTWTTLSSGQENLTPSEFRRLITTTRTKQEVDPTTTPSTITGDLVASTVQRKDNTGKSLKVDTTETIAAGDPLEGEKTGTWGIEGTTRQPVTEGSTTPSGFLTKGSSVVPLGNGKSIESVETYPAVESTNVVYTLLEEKTDQITATPVYIKKSLVNASAASALAAVDRTALWFPEIKALDKWHSILISSKLDASILNVTQNWIETKNISLPNVLSEVGVIWDSDVKGDFGSTGAEDIQKIVSDKISWSVRAEASASGVVQGRPYTKILRGYNGAARVSVERTFVYGPPSTLDASVQPYDFGEVYGTLTIHGEQVSVGSQSQKNGKGGTSVTFATNVRTHSDGNMAIHQFGPVVHSGVTLNELGDPSTVNANYMASGGSTPSGGYYPVAVAKLTATGLASLKMDTGGTPLVSGDTYLLDVRATPYRLGYWVIEKYTATVP
mgnify:CR=1 FL=1|tara:strand:- start:363 stop:1943 length:1581 start_codon:yes stop_codon:yes gene_type:complete